MQLILLQAKTMFDPTSLLFMAGMLGVMYFFFIRPQSQKAKEQAKFIDGLEKGAKVVTTQGMHGKILKVEDATFLVEFDANVKIRIEKSGISSEMTIEANKEKKADSETKAS